MPASMYMVGDLGLAAQRPAATSARAKQAIPDPAETRWAATVPNEKQPIYRRRRAKDIMLGHGHEYMDLDQELDYADPESAVTASDRSAGPIGFAGSAARAGAAEPGGLATRTEDQFGGSATVPMLPSTWNKDPE